MYIFLVMYFVQSQDEDEESTTVPFSATDEADDESVEDVSLIIPTRTINNPMSNESKQNVNQVNSSEPSKQRIIIALAVLCAALAVLLGFLVSIVVCQWWQHDKDDGDAENETSKARPDLVGPSYNYHDQAYRQAIKL
jgi:cytoskeletal protein RodZ